MLSLYCAGELIMLSYGLYWGSYDTPPDCLAARVCFDFAPFIYDCFMLLNVAVLHFSFWPKFYKFNPAVWHESEHTRMQCYLR